MPVFLGAGTIVDLGPVNDPRPVPPAMPPLARLLKLHQSLVEETEPVFPAPPGYKLPWLAGVGHKVAQGANEGITHGSLRAWDFDLRYELVLAARGGLVSMVRAGERLGGCDGAYLGRANYVLIDHGDGTSALYLHIDYQGALVEKGAVVAQGQAIAYSGSSGLSCGGGGWAGPHLHFQVEETVPGEWWTKTLPISFEELDGKAPVTGKSYESANPPSNLMSRVLASQLLQRPARGTEVTVSPSRSFLAQMAQSARPPMAPSEPPAYTPTPSPTATSTPVPSPTPTPPRPTPAPGEWINVTFRVTLLSSYFDDLCSSTAGGCALWVCAPTGTCTGSTASISGLTGGVTLGPLRTGDHTVSLASGDGVTVIGCGGAFTIPDHDYVEIATTDGPACSISLAIRR